MTHLNVICEVMYLGIFQYIGVCAYTHTLAICIIFFSSTMFVAAVLK